MSKTLFRQEAINMLRKNPKVTYISEKSIVLHLNLELNVNNFSKCHPYLVKYYWRTYEKQ